MTDRDVSQLVRSTLQPVLDARSKALADANRSILERKPESDSPSVEPKDEPPHSSSGKTPRVWNTDPPISERIGKYKLALATAFAAVLIVVAVLWIRTSAHVATQQSPAARPSPSVASVAQLVTITLRTDPQEAELRIDQGPKLTSPQVITTEPNEQLHVIVAGLEGFESQSRQVVFDHNQEIFLGLKQKAPISAPSASSGKTTIAVQRPPNQDAVNIRNMKPKRPKRSLDPSNPFADP